MVLGDRLQIRAAYRFLPLITLGIDNVSYKTLWESPLRRILG